MLTSIQFVSNILLLLLLPYAMTVVIVGKWPMHSRRLARYFHAAPLLRSLSGKVIISLCIGSIARDARLFGFVGDSARDVLTVGLGVPFCAIALSFLTIATFAVAKVHLE